MTSSSGPKTSPSGKDSDGSILRDGKVAEKGATDRRDLLRKAAIAGTVLLTLKSAPALADVTDSVTASQMLSRNAP